MGIKRESDIDFGDYDNILFVDGSGDDGIKFERNSSKTFVVACFVVSVHDIDYNCEVLKNAKKCVGANPNQEVKSTTILRHKNRSNALEALKEARGQLYLMVAYKEQLRKIGELTDEMVNAKHLTSLCHTFPLEMSQKHMPSLRSLILIDNMKHVEMDLVSHLLTEHVDKVDFCFVDSKARRFPLMHLADFFAGITREFFEHYIEKNGFQNRCATCVNITRKRKAQKLCRNPSNMLPERADSWHLIRRFLARYPDTFFNSLLIYPYGDWPSFEALNCRQK